MDDYGALIASGQNLVPDLQRQLLQRAQIAAYGSQVQQNQAQTAAIQQKQVRAQQFQQAFQASDGSPQAVSRLIMQFPEFAEQLKQGWDVSDKANHERDLTDLSEVYSAANGGNWTLAAKTAHARAEAERAAGRTDGNYDQVLDILDKAAAGDTQAQATAKTMMGSMIAAKTGPEHFASVYGALKGDVHVVPVGGIMVDDNGQTVAHSPLVQGADGSLYDYNSVMGGTAQTKGGDPSVAAPSGGFDNAVAFTLKHEGGYAPSDRNGAPVNFGINAKANPGVDVKNLTQEQARQIYHDKYWVPSGAENLPAAMQTPYFDTYVLNPKQAQKMLAKSDNDPVKFLQLRQNWLKGLEQSGKYDKAWTNRTNDLMAMATSGEAGGSTASPGPRVLLPGKNSPDNYHVLTPDEVTARGLDPAQQYQLNTQTGQVTGLGKKDGASDDILAKYHIGNSETGATVLNKLPANLASQVKALSEGRLPMPSSFALAKPYWQNMLQLTAQYDPSFDAANAPARKAAITAFTGMGKGAQVVGSVNRVANHLNTLWEKSEKLAGPETGSGLLNKALATAGQSFEPADAKAYDTAVGFVAGELEKIARNSPGTEAGVERVISSLNRRNSKKTREEAIRTAVDIISGAIDPLKDQYNSAFTNGSTRPHIPWVTPKAQAVYKKINGADLSLTGSGADSNNASASSSATGGAVRIHTAQEWHNLAPGTVYIDPTGVQRTKK